VDPSRLRVALATDRDRDRIYRIRHSVYARELHQHPENQDNKLTDSLDSFNECIVTSVDRDIVGFVAITPPGHHYSIDKYLARHELPLSFDDRLYEVRLLTVVPPRRRSRLVFVLLYAAFRWVETRGGDTIVAIGRRAIPDFYLKVGFRTLGHRVKSGALTYELMSATITQLREHVSRYDRLVRNIQLHMDWALDMPVREPLSCFHGGAFFGAIGTEFDRLDNKERIINAEVLDAWFPPSPKVTAAISADLPWLLCTSPPTHSEGLIKTIAEKRGVDRESVLAGAGSSSLMYLAFRQWLTPASRVLILDPTYGEYHHIFENVVGCRIDRLNLDRVDGFKVDTAVLEDSLRTAPDLVILVNPNSPTGQHVSRTELERVLTNASRRTRVWIDETYVEYAGADQSLERFAAVSPNVFVCKSMSKVYALSGARVAYLCGSPRTLRNLRSLLPPWSVNLPAQVAAVYALKDPGYYAERYRETHVLRAELERRLSEIRGLEVLPSTTNFLLCFLERDGQDAETVVRACRARGLFLRNAATMSARLGKHALRITVKSGSDNERIATILNDVLKRAP
jgi:histidinol-phosphate/aromatic aminotransferase/cobyric acid decarboxylase-like protein